MGSEPPSKLTFQESRPTDDFEHQKCLLIRDYALPLKELPDGVPQRARSVSLFGIRIVHSGLFRKSAFSYT